MDKSTYNDLMLLCSDPHMSGNDNNDLRLYPHKDIISFIVLTKHAPKSTYSPSLNSSIVKQSDKCLRSTIEEMMDIFNIGTPETEEQDEVD